MRIGIDCRMSGLQRAGIGRYVENLVRELSKVSSKDKEVEFVLIKSNIPHYSLQEQILLPLQLIKLKLDLIHFPHFNAPILYFKPYVVTIHDLIKHASRGKKTTTRNSFLYWLKYLGYRFVFWNAVKRARKILVPSEWVKQELVKQYKLDHSKVVVTYEGVSKNFQFPISNFQTNSKFPPKARLAKGGKIQNSKLLKKYKIRKPFVIYTGSLYPHKNIEWLIEAVKLLTRRVRNSKPDGLTRGLSLVIVCARSVFSERLKKKAEELGVKRLVNLVGFVPDEELVKIYQEAVTLVQPSLMEGFDLTVVEAMAVGLPVVVSDIPVHREICGGAALYFDPKNVDDMANKIKLVLKNQLLRNKLSKLGLNRVKKYSWQKTARQTLKVYQSI